MYQYKGGESVILRSTEIGEEGGHEAGKRLLTEMYEACFGEPVPLILVTERGLSLIHI